MAPTGSTASRRTRLRAASEDPTRAPVRRRKRPVPVTLVALLALALAVYYVVNGVLEVRSGQDERLVEGIFHLVLGAGALAAAFGAYRMHAWGWAAFMTWAVIGLTHQILRYLFFDDPNFADMAINAFVVLALSPVDVQIAFGIRHTEHVELTRATRNPVDRA